MTSTAEQVLGHLAALGLTPTDSTVEPVAVDQTNESFVVGREYVVKVRPDPIPVDDVALVRMRRLAAAGFTGTPALHGVTGPAIVTSFVPGAVDGWTWCVGECRTALDVEHVEIPGAPAGATPAVPGWATDLGTLTASMHRALAEPDGSVLGHGDYHVGQVLRSPDGRLWVIDFDGNPTLTPEERAAPRPAAYDVAGILLSLENVGHVVRRWSRDAGVDLAEAPVADWTRTAQDQLLAGYRTAAGDLLDETLLEPLVLDQIQRELAYAERFLPRWRYVPEAALTRRGLR